MGGNGRKGCVCGGDSQPAVAVRGGGVSGGGEPAAALKPPLPVGVTAGQGASGAGGRPGLRGGSGPRYRAPPARPGRGGAEGGARLAARLCPPVSLATGWERWGAGSAMGMSPRWHLGLFVARLCPGFRGAVGQVCWLQAPWSGVSS